MDNHGITGYGDTIEDVKIENMSKDDLETHKQALIKTIKSIEYQLKYDYNLDLTSKNKLWTRLGLLSDRVDAVTALQTVLEQEISLDEELRLINDDRSSNEILRV